LFRNISIKRLKKHRPKNPGRFVLEGQEPIDFAVCFNAFRFGKQRVVGLIKDLLAEYTQTFTYEQLKERDKLPKTVDKALLEEYLSDSEFVTVFGIDKKAWADTPAWKKSEEKKRVGLY